MTIPKHFFFFFFFAQCDTYAHTDNVDTSWKTEDHMASPGYEATDSFESSTIDIKSNIQTCLLLCFYASVKFWKGWHKKYVGLIGICWLRIGILSRCYLFESALMPINTMTKFPTLWNLKHSYYKLQSHSGHRHKHARYFLVFSAQVEAIGWLNPNSKSHQNYGSLQSP
jgi:hypothetical protein